MSLPLVFLHGWGLRGAVWEACVDAAAAFGYSAHAPDLPGFGEVPEGHPYQVEALADALAAAMPATCCVVGWSLGGLVAQAWAARHPQQVQALVLVGATPAFLARADWPHGLSAEVLAGFAESLVTDQQATLLRFLSLQARGGEAAREVIGHLRARLLDGGATDLETLRAGLDLLRDSDLRNLAAAIRGPCLVLHGSHDSLCPVGAGRWLAEHIPDAELTIHPHAAHAPFLSHPDWFNERLRAFMVALGK